LHLWLLDLLLLMDYRSLLLMDYWRSLLVNNWWWLLKYLLGWCRLINRSGLLGSLLTHKNAIWRCTIDCYHSRCWSDHLLYLLNLLDLLNLLNLSWDLSVSCFRLKNIFKNWKNCFKKFSHKILKEKQIFWPKKLRKYKILKLLKNSIKANRCRFLKKYSQNFLLISSPESTDDSHF
jgi:hypothetical protein